MSKLLTANLTRLKKNKLFWIQLIAMFVFGIVLVLDQYSDQIKLHTDSAFDTVFLGYILPIGVLMAVFSSLFLGAEYSDGTIRNKLIIGHTRLRIYFSNLVTNIAVSFLLCLSYLLAVLTVGIPLLGPLTSDIKAAMLMLLGTVVLAIAFCSVFTLISMVCANKAVVAVISILLVVGLFLLSIMINAKLNAPEFYDNYMFSGSLETMANQSIPNPAYLRGTKRAVYAFLKDFLPTGQALQYSNLSAVHLWQMPLYSLLITVAATSAGALIFHRKDLK